ncbi:uncharacterized protein STEHIDRAFT_109667 [Stereum hirsutum FP-91666 SS1]|uniref:uncharacterized protein n=1 Tax=Stereum hirsutum (strain FP-91666) TaxID=721885 RepID=UPI000440F86E|nr:uncharacterized protein STEHIDRAFT_109667 [Stereum hirsutum FP-91666 SS1]EIM87786.1 hypothetical protein STEHIDRAFT_109667 [Stereum hirsutum FP-91666 SS1]
MSTDWDAIKAGAQKLHSSANTPDSPLRNGLPDLVDDWNPDEIWVSSDVLYRLPYFIESARLHRQLGRDGFERGCDTMTGPVTWICIKAAKLYRDQILEEKSFIPRNDDDMGLWIMGKFFTVSAEYKTERFLPEARAWVKMMLQLSLPSGLAVEVMRDGKMLLNPPHGFAGNARGPFGSR